jgi:hypothetical protein
MICACASPASVVCLCLSVCLSVCLFFFPLLRACLAVPDSAHDVVSILSNRKTLRALWTADHDVMLLYHDETTLSLSRSIIQRSLGTKYIRVWLTVFLKYTAKQ